MLTKRVLLASGATLALASTVRGQAYQGSNQAADDMLNHQAAHIAPNGRHRMMVLNEAGDAAVKQYGTELKGHAMFYREGGKNYVLHDQKMADGSMLFDKAGEWQAKT